MSNLWIDNVLQRVTADDRLGAGVPRSVELGGPLPVEVVPARTLPHSAAFYDQESDILAVNILPFNPYDAFVESEDIRIDTDRFGSPIYIEVAQAQKDWTIEPVLPFPSVSEAVELSIRETTRRFPGGSVSTDPAKSIARIRLLAREDGALYRVADHLLAEVADGYLVGFWVDRIEMDFAGRKQARWRAETANTLRRNGIEWHPCSAGKNRRIR